MNEVYNSNKDINSVKDLLLDSLILTISSIITFNIFPILGDINNVYSLFRIFFTSILITHFYDKIKYINQIVIALLSLSLTCNLFYFKDYSQVTVDLVLLGLFVASYLFSKFNITLIVKDNKVEEKDLVVYKTFLEEFYEEMLKSENKDETLRIYTEDMYDNFD